MGVGRPFADKGPNFKCRDCVYTSDVKLGELYIAPLLLAAEMADHGLAGGDHQNVITLHYTAPAAAGLGRCHGQ